MVCPFFIPPPVASANLNNSHITSNGKLFLLQGVTGANELRWSHIEPILIDHVAPPRQLINFHRTI